MCVCVCVCVCVGTSLTPSQVVDNSALVFTACSRSARDEWLGLSQVVLENVHSSMPAHGLLDFQEYVGVFLFFSFFFFLGR